MRQRHRVFASYLLDEGLVDAGSPVSSALVLAIRHHGRGRWHVQRRHGRGRGARHLQDHRGRAHWEAQDIRTGNPHAVAFVDSLTDPGPLLDAPEHDSETYPDGVNVEFVVREGDRHVSMRVHERGSGETRSCGTGAGASAWPPHSPTEPSDR